MHVREYIEKYYPEYYSWNSYPADKVAAFCEVDGPWGILSNFGRTPIVVDGVEFYATESLFQVMKFKCGSEARKVIYPIKGQGLKMKAKHYEKTDCLRPDWGCIFVDVLKFCLVTKYEQSEEFRQELARTQGLYIVEVQPRANKPADTYNAKLTPDGQAWEGPNLMGRLLMELRDNGTLQYNLPAGIVDFSDLR